jgi:hypothetical protein
MTTVTTKLNISISQKRENSSCVERLSAFEGPMNAVFWDVTPCGS